MSRFPEKPAFIPGMVAVIISAPSASLAAESTSRGLISVSQVTQMLEKSPTDLVAQQVLTAYLAGVGEAAGAMADMGGATCRAPLSLSAENVRQALKPVTAQHMAETPATRLIVRDMLTRAGCQGR